ncbi:hypothetical protein [Dactylosporangium darangshiense]|uniref:hypothetical protein n=1 Tax=Dactylosporangium darangshiense TaxID=579108 RepID=UPI0031EEE18D
MATFGILAATEPPSQAALGMQPVRQRRGPRGDARSCRRHPPPVQPTRRRQEFDDGDRLRGRTR